MIIKSNEKTVSNNSFRELKSRSIRNSPSTEQRREKTVEKKEAKWNGEQTSMHFTLKLLSKANIASKTNWT